MITNINPISLEFLRENERASYQFEMETKYTIQRCKSDAHTHKQLLIHTIAASKFSNKQLPKRARNTEKQKYQ